MVKCLVIYSDFCINSYYDAYNPFLRIRSV